MDKELVFAVRKQNLERVMLDRFKGNKAALSRATGTHPNHINLILSSNDAHKRNLGEILARKIEQQLGLPARWLDTPHDGSTVEMLTTIEAPPVHETLSGALRACEQLSGLSVSTKQASGLFRRVTAVENLIAAAIDTNDMAPELSDGDTVIVDTAVKAISGDGVYLVIRGGGSPMLRRVARSAAGETTVSAGSEAPVVMSPAAMKALKVVGRIVVVAKFVRL